MTYDRYPKATLEAWDDQHVWHPFTPHSLYRDESPLLVVAGDGNYVIDHEGRRYLDGVASLWCNAFGHRHPHLDAALRAQMERIAHATMLGNATEPAIILAKRLADLAPEGLRRVFYSDNGSTAVEIALKMAYQLRVQHPDPAQQRKTRFIALRNAYNGDTIGSVSVGGIDLFHGKFKALLFDVLHGPSPYCYRCPLGKERRTCGTACLEQTLQLIEDHASEVTAVILETGMQGAAGILPLPEGFLRRVREVTRRHDVLLILDEVATGCGRSGTFFACAQEDVAPDFLCVAKMLTGGYLPLAATLTTEQVFRGFLGAASEARTFYHGHTFTGNPLGAAVALAALDLHEREDGAGDLGAKIAHLQHALSRLHGIPGVGDVRAYGLCAGIELVHDRATKTPFTADRRAGMRVCLRAREHGIFLRPLGDVIVLMPPLSITLDEIDHLVDGLAASLREELRDAT